MRSPDNKRSFRSGWARWGCQGCGFAQGRKEQYKEENPTKKNAMQNDKPSQVHYSQIRDLKLQICGQKKRGLRRGTVPAEKVEGMAVENSGAAQISQPCGKRRGGRDDSRTRVGLLWAPRRADTISRDPRDHSNLVTAVGRELHQKTELKHDTTFSYRIGIVSSRA